MRCEWKNVRSELAQRCFLLISTNVTSERPNCACAYDDSVVGSFESTRSGEMAAEVLIGYATDGRSGGGQRNSVGDVDGNGRIQLLCWRERSRSCSFLVFDLAKAFERVILPLVWLGRRTSASQGRYCGCYAVTLSTSGTAAPDHHGVLRAMRLEVEEGLKLSITEGGKEAKSKFIASCSYLEEKFPE